MSDLCSTLRTEYILSCENIIHFHKSDQQGCTEGVKRVLLHKDEPQDRKGAAAVWSCEKNWEQDDGRADNQIASTRKTTT